MEKDFEGRTVGITGYSFNSTFYDLAIHRIIELEGGKVEGDSGYDNTWEIGQTIIVGDYEFDKEYLIQSIEAGIEHNFTCHYIAMEDFLESYFYEEEPYFKGDPRIEKHSALSFLASLGFKYPSVDIFNFGSGNQSIPKEWKIESILKAYFGYSVRRGISESSRRKALKDAVESPNIITLQEIAKHIVCQINLKKGRKSMSLAVERWTSDLDWLKETYYNNSIRSFIFPNS